MKSTITHLLLLSVGFTFSLISFRVFYSGSPMYLFFVWNLFLAGIPLFISTYLIRAKKKNLQWILFAVWLLFFPNALYIITDLAHLEERYPVPLWFDVVLIFSAAINGLIMAYTSLHQADLFLQAKFNSKTAKLIVFGCLFLGSFGVYIGRFLRWNSWDIVVNPLGLLFEIVQHIMNPFQHSRTWGMTIVLTGFFSIFYFIIKKLPGVMEKRE